MANEKQPGSPRGIAGFSINVQERRAGESTQMDVSALRLLSFIRIFLIDCANAISLPSTLIFDTKTLIKLDR